MKKLVSLLMCLALLLSLIPVGMISASAEVIPVTFNFMYTMDGAVAIREEIWRTDTDGYVPYVDTPDRTDENLWFCGWYTSTDFDWEEQLVYPMQITEATTFYARWVSLDDCVTVSWYHEADDAEPVVTIPVPSGDYFTPPEPGIEGKVFFNWYTDPDFEEIYNGYVYEDTSLYPRYVDEEDIVTVRWFLDPSDEEPVAGVEQIIGDWFMPAEPGREGKVFVGWYTDRNFNNYYEGIVEGDTDLYPRFVDKDQVVSVRRCFDLNEQLFYETRVIKGDTYLPPEPEAEEGMVFVGWYTDPNYGQLYDATAAVTSDLDLYPKFLPEDEVVYYDVCIYLDPDDVQMTAGFEVPKNVAPGKIDDPGRIGATFGGWFTDRSLTVPYDPNRAYNEDISVYAKFTWPNPAITGFSNTEGGLKVSWTDVGEGEYYTLFRKGPKDKKWVKIAVAIEDNYYFDNTAVSGTTYTYTVRCVNYWGKTYQSGYNTTGWTYTAFDMPALTKLVPAAAGMSMAWSKSDGVYGYRVFRKNDAGNWTSIATVTGTSYTDTTVVSGNDYTYTVRAVNKVNKKYTYVTDYDHIGMTASYVAMPKISKIENTNTGAKLAWAKCSGAKKYRVFIKSGTSWKKLTDTASLTYIHTAAASGKTYTYTVRALDINGAYCSAYDSTGWKNQFIAAPALPTLKSTKYGVQITSTMPAGAVKYCVFRKEAGATKWTRVITNISATAPFVTDATAKSGKKYTYTIRCLSKDGKSYVSGYNATGRTITYKK